MHPLSLVVFLTLAAGPDRPIPAGCREDHGTCREDCTIDYGGSTTKYRQLTQCIQRCDKEQKECADRHYTLQDAQIDPLPARQPDPAVREPEPYEQPKSDTVPASGKETSGSPVRQGVYRAAEEAPPTPAEPPKPAPAPEPKPAPKQEPAAPVKTQTPAKKATPEPEKRDEVPIFDKDEPEPEPVAAPKPAPKPAEPQRAPPPPEPKKKDIADWDPNGN